MQDQDVYCADASLSVEEPLAGSAAAETEFWIVLEHAQPWGPKGLEDSGIPEPVVAHLRALSAAQPRLRVQLVRRPERVPATPMVYLAHTPERGGSLFELGLGSLQELPALGLSGWLSGGTPPPHARPLATPLYLVCVHGRRDRCCARRGMPVYNALRAQAGDSVWQTSHLGGHRFAATLVVLPYGICYGRVQPDEVSALRAAHERGEMYDLERVRGRTCYAPTVQAAEIFVRRASGERGLAALRCAAVHPGPEAVRVVFERSDASTCETEVARAALAPAPASCGARPKPGEALVPLRRP